MSVTRMSRRLRQERDTVLTATQLAALGTIRREGPLTIGAIAAAERVQPPSMTRTVNYLTDLGLVRRDAHPHDGRQVVISLSDRGARLLETERRRRDAWLAQRLRALPPADREVLRRAAELLGEVAAS